MSYTVNIRNKYHNFIDKIDEFETYKEAENFIKESHVEIDNSCEYFEIKEAE